MTTLIAGTRQSDVSGWTAFRVMCRWRVLQLRRELPFVVFAQLFFATGTALGLAFLIPEVDARAASYLATGSFLLNLLVVGMAIVPSSAAQAQETGTFDYMWALPVPRLTYLVADLAVWTLAVLPGLAVSLVVTSLRFDFALRPNLWIVPAVLGALIGAASVGYAVALRLPSAQLVNLLSNLALVMVLLFSPVNFPIGRLPGWLQAVHQVLPIAAMADLVRAGLLGTEGTQPIRDLLVVGAWVLIGTIGTLRAVSRRP